MGLLVDIQATPQGLAFKGCYATITQLSYDRTNKQVHGFVRVYASQQHSVDFPDNAISGQKFTWDSQHFSR